MPHSRDSRRARRVLSAAAPHLGGHVVVIAPGHEGLGFLATSMPTASIEDLKALESMLREAVKKVAHWKRARIEVAA